MNRLRGHILNIRSADHLSCLSLEASGYPLTAIILQENGPEGTGFQQGEAIELLFKEISVRIAKGPDNQLSIANGLRMAVKAIKKGEILSRLELTGNGISITALNLTACLQSMNLEIGDEVSVLIPANEITLEKPVRHGS